MTTFSSRFSLHFFIWLKRHLPTAQSEQISQMAKVLVFTTLITLVPLLAVSFALLRGFGFSQVLEPWLHGLFKPMGAQGTEIVHYLLQFVAQTDGQSLGIVGVIFLLFSVQKLRQQMGDALNHLWGVPLKRLSALDLLSTIGFMVLLPLLLAWLLQTLQRANEQSAWLAQGLGLLALWGLISALYALLPNTRVSPRAALCGAALFMLCWLPLSSAFAIFMRYSHSYSVIYSSFAALIVLLLWLQSIWWLFLLGAQLSVWLQQPHTLHPTTHTHRHEQLALDALALMDAQFHAGQSALSLAQLAHQTHSPPHALQAILATLAQAGLVVQVGEAQYQMGVAAEGVSVSRVAAVLYGEGATEIWWQAQSALFYQQSLREYREKRYPTPAPKRFD